jgi:hypothetical protein
MSLSLEAVGMSLFGGVAGAIGLSLLTLLAHWLHEPRVLSDGQYGMVFMLTIPCGGWLGLAAGLAMHYGNISSNVAAGRICLIAGALVLVPLLLFLLLAFFSKRGIAEWLFWFGLSAAWASAMVYRGIQFLHPGTGI